MPDDFVTRWTVSVSKDTDITVRSFLARRGMKKGDLSKFIEEAVKWRVYDQTLAEARGKFADLSPEELEAVIDEAVTAAAKRTVPKRRDMLRPVAVTRAADDRHEHHDQCLADKHLAAGASHRAMARGPFRSADLAGAIGRA